MVHPTDGLRRHTERQCTWKRNSRRVRPTRWPRRLFSFSYSKVPTCYPGVEHTIRPSMGLENEECSTQSYPNKRCGHGQTYWQRDVEPATLGGWINEIGDDPWWRLQAWPEEQSLCCRCHRLCCRIGHGEVSGQYCSALT